MGKLHKVKDGAALIIALGFLAILSMTIFFFALQSRTEQLSSRTFSSGARTRYLLDTALSRAMQDIDVKIGSTAFPPFPAFGSQSASGSPLADDVKFNVEEDFFATENDLIWRGYQLALQNAKWQPVHDIASTTICGRVGYVVINSSGLLDANAVGGMAGPSAFFKRGAGLSPKEIQLEKGGIIPEFNASTNATSFPHIDSNNPHGILKAASQAALSPALAFVHNRENAWRRFETLRDVRTLNQISANNIISSTRKIASFSTFSFDPSEDGRTFMGTNSATLAKAFILDQLEKNRAINAEFVMNQLEDYLDTDTLPEDRFGEYTDMSVEPVPLINELVFTCRFSFTNFARIGQYQSGNPDTNIAVAVNNSYSLDIELWYPFIGYTNTSSFAIQNRQSPTEDGALPTNLFDSILLWVNDFSVSQASPWFRQYKHDGEWEDRLEYYTLHEGVSRAEYETAGRLEADFAAIQSNIQFPLIQCIDENAGEKGRVVDQVRNLELPLVDAVQIKLVPQIRDYAKILFDPASEGFSTTLVFCVSMSAIDPRLNWDGASSKQWRNDFSAQPAGTIDTLGTLNVMEDFIDETNKVFVRNNDRIDTPWEFTYFLYNPSNPWKTMQMLEELDDDDTRYILAELSPYPPGTRPKHGRVNPYSPHTNVIASVFMNMPVDEFNAPYTHRLTAEEAVKAACLFIDYMAEKKWPANAAAYGNTSLPKAMSKKTPWSMESFFRNTYELFNPRDTLFTILLAAQSAIDSDSDGVISDEEITGAQKAVVYVWRDPKTKKAACVFYGRSDILQSGRYKEQTWSAILRNFAP